MQDWALSDPRKSTIRFKKSDRTRNSPGPPFHWPNAHAIVFFLNRHHGERDMVMEIDRWQRDWWWIGFD